MKTIYFSCIFWLSFNVIEGQPITFSFKSFSFSPSYGISKIQLFHNNHPVITIGLNKEVLNYSPSWCFAARSNWKLTDRIDVILSIEHLTVTERDTIVIVPRWGGLGEKGITQGFIHIVPNFNFLFRSPDFSINFGPRIGTANFIGRTNARESSNSIFNLDFGFNIGSSIRIFKELYLSLNWINGTTQYRIVNDSRTFFWRYHSYLGGINYYIK